jgi:CelD/BcsL family acetyltransferase involved in cellulose biosynthesis
LSDSVSSSIATSLSVTTETLDSLTPEWQELLARSGVRWPFLQPAWLRVWMATQPVNGELLLLAVRDGGRLKGILPLIRNGSDFTLAGDSDICDYMDLIVETGSYEAVLDAALAHLNQLPCERVRFWGLRADSPALEALPEFAERFAFEYQREEEAVCPRVQLPETWDDYLLSLSKKDRHELRRKIRRMSEAGGEVRDYALSDPDEILAAMPDFFRLHRESRQDKAEFMSASMERFFVEMTSALSKDDLVRLFFLEIDEKRVASVLAFNCDDELWLYNSGFDPGFASASVGLVSKALVLRHAIADGKRCYDFLRGAEPYKYDLGGRDLQVYRAELRRQGSDA